MAVGCLVISYMQPPTGVVTFLCSSTTSLPEQHHWSSPSNNMIIWHPLMHDGEWGARPWNWCLRRCLKRKTFKMDERKIDFTLISLHGWCLENKPVLCPLCVAALSLTRKRGDPFLSLLLILSNTHMVTHTKQRQKQPCMRRRKLLRCWSTDRENKDGRSFSTLPCLTWAVDLNDIVNKMFLYFLSWKIKPSLKLSLTLLWISSSFLPFLSLPPSFSVSLFNKEPLCLVKQKVPWSHFTLHQNVTGLRWHNDHSVGTKNLSYFISTFEELV